MKCTVLLFAFVLPAVLAAGQNLVPNGSFEEYQDCPMTLDALYQCDYWFNALGTCDYYNDCNTAGLGVPNNVFGYQWAFHGQAYSGLVSFDQVDANYREIISVELFNPLTIGEEIFFSFWYNRAGEGPAMSRASNNLGLKFCSIDEIINESLVNNQAVLKVDTIVYDSLYWHRLMGSFVPQTAFTHLVIGNFFEDSQTLSEPDGPNSNRWAYFFIDDIRVSTDSAFVNSVGLQNIPRPPYVKFYPTYADDWIKLCGKGQFRSVQIISSQGIEMMRLESGMLPQVIHLTNHPSGMYFLRLEHHDGQVQVFKYFKK